jgi:DedD protein
MADRIADDAGLVMDDLKRKARRRLVGAIVLALAAAIILPMLLEKEPRPLGDDVAVQIPPVDEGKFINRLTGKSADVKPLPKAELKADLRTDPKSGQGKPDAKPEAKAEARSEMKTEAKTDAKTEAKSEAPPDAKSDTKSDAASAQGKGAPPAGDTLVPKKAVAEAEQRVLSPSSRPPAKVDARPAPDAKVATKASAAPPKAEASAEPKPAAEAKAEPKSATTEPRPASVAVASPAPSPTTTAPTPAKPEGFVVQLAAFADDKGANALANKLKKSGYAAYVEPVETSRGTLWRVRVGGYGSRPDADAARAKLKGEGYSGIVTPAK